MKNQMKGKKGITLIALVITILVILILAGVTIATLTGDNGLLQKAQTSKERSTDAEIEEQIILAWNKVYSDSYLNGFTAEQKAKALKDELGNNAELKSDNVTVEYRGKTIVITETGEMEIKQPMPQVTAGQKAEKDSEYKSGKYTAVIPAGYTVSNVEGETNIDTGLVIKKNGNEWVWIPVSLQDLAVMYAEDTTGWTMSGTSGDSAVVTKYKTIGTLSRGNPGTTDWREPDILNNTSFDNNESNWIVAGFSSFSDMATKLRDDYKAMIDSVKKYGGFYVGRYELSNAGTQKDQACLTVSWYELYKKCRDIESSNNSVVTTMIFGCQWDQVCEFIITAKDADGNTISLIDSNKYGNYGSAQAPANKGNYKQGEWKNTGSNEAWKTNNIYDLAGNYWEWTQEAYGLGRRTYRGGSYYDDGNQYSVTYRKYEFPSYSGIATSRPVLYIK